MKKINPYQLAQLATILWVCHSILRFIHSFLISLFFLYAMLSMLMKPTYVLGARLETATNFGVLIDRLEQLALLQ